MMHSLQNMTRDCECYQCIPLYKEKVLSRMLRIIHEYDSCILLDLEDGIQDVCNPLNNKRLKELSRKVLLNLFTLLSPEDLPRYNLNIRINSYGSEFFTHDLKVLQSIKVTWNSIFIPKIETRSDIENYIRTIKQNGILTRELIPILETKKAILNLENILTGSYEGMCRVIFFGNYDYNLDSGIFPVVEQKFSEYWDFISPIIQRIEQAGYYFGNSPYAYIGDSETFYRILCNLFRRCSKPFSQISLHISQTRICNNFNKNYNFQYDSISPLVSIRQEKNLSSAEEIVHLFQENRLKGRSFSLITGTERIITPQEYLLAIRSADE